MFNRTRQIRSRRSKLEGEQLDISFPRRGRPSKFRRLERAGQMRLTLGGAIRPKYLNSSNITIDENLGDSLQMMFSAPSTAITPDNPITDADVPF